EKSRYRRWGIAPRPENKANINYQMGRNQGAMARRYLENLTLFRRLWGKRFGFYNFGLHVSES
ncbi:hypothetical protein, partial [Agrobacterium tumefaciens]